MRARRSARLDLSVEGQMRWIKPRFVEIRLGMEINGYAMASS